MKFKYEAFSLVAERQTFEDIVKEARGRQKGSERGWWDDESFVRMLETKLKRTKR